MNENSDASLVSLVGAGPGDPGLITLRGVQCLQEADIVAYDRLANPILLQLAPQAELIPVGKQPNHHPIPQEGINALLIEKALEGKRVVRLKGGDPFVFGRGGEEAQALAEAGIPFEIVPGVTSAVSVPAYAGIPITTRGIADSVALITGHRSADVENPEEGWLKGSFGADTLVFFMGVKNLAQIVEQLLKSGRGPDTPAALIERGTSAAQKTVAGNLGNIVEHAAAIRPPAILVVGEVVKKREHLRWFDLHEQRPLFGLRILNTKSFPSPSQPDQITKYQLGDEFDNLVSRLGGEVFHYPVIQITPPSDPEPLTQAVQRLVSEHHYQWVIFTSVNGVEAFFDQLSAQGLDTRSLNGIQVAAVGKITAQALKSRGITPDFVPAHFTGAELGKTLPIQPGEVVLLSRSEIALPELPDILAERGCFVEEVSAYSVESAPPDKNLLQQLLEKKIDVVAFFSPSGFKGLADMLVQADYDLSLAEILAPLSVACIGPTTRQVAEKFDIRVDIIAEEYTSIGLVKAIKTWRER